MLKRVVALLFFVFLTIPAIAQSFGGINFKNMKADDLSNEQIRAIYERAQDEGYSIQELETLATARGMAPVEVTKLRRRLSEIRLKIGREEADSRFDSDGRVRQDQDNFYQAEDDTTQLIDSTASVDKTEKPIFGSELFTNERLSFEPSQNIPTPKNYQLGPSDELMIDIWGAAENNYQLTVSPEGAIQISNIGPIYVNGMSIDEASKIIIERLSSIYSGLTGPRKDTYAQVSLGRVRTIKVNIVGEVRMPGTYSISSLSTVFNALYVSGGPSKNGTYRGIQVIRGGEIIQEVDLYDFLVYGEQHANISLRDQDIIKIGPYKNRITLEGETKIQGLFETKDGETFENLLDFSGGFNQQAYTKRIKITRNTDTERSIVEIHYPEEKSTALKSGDEIFVGEILERYANRVEIQGAVFREGEYQLEENSTLYTLIQHADGLMGDAYMERAIIYRTLPDYTVKNIQVNLAQLMNNPEENDIALVKDDLVHVSSIFDLREDFTVTISGEILTEGTFPYRENMTIKDLIYMANGFTSKAAAYNIEVARRIIDDDIGQIKNKIADIYNLKITDNLAFNNPDTEFELKPFDQVFVRRSPSYVEQKSVTIEGQVLYPGTYVIDSRDFTIADLVNKAGGVTEFAYLPGASLERKFKNLEESLNKDSTNVIGLKQETLSQVGIRLDDILKNPNSDRNLLLVPGDKLDIPSKMQTVNVQGEVLFPINVQYSADKGFRSYVRSAGGYTETANKKRAYVVYANGEVDRTSRFLFFKSYPDIKPGSMIFIPKKEERAKVSSQERIAILSTVVSMAAIVTSTIFQIRRN